MAKNGSIIKQAIQLINYTSGFNQTMHVDAVVLMNGSDCIEAYYETNSGTSTILGGALSTFMIASYAHE